MLKRWMCALLAIAMCVSLLPVSALGAELETTTPSEAVTEATEVPAVTAGEEETQAPIEAETVPAASTEAATEPPVTQEATEATEEATEATEAAETQATEATEAIEEVVLCAHGEEVDCPVCALEARLALLPGEDALASMTEEERAALLEELAALMDAYDALTAEQQAMVTGMERLTALYAVLSTNAVTLEAADANEVPEGKYLNGEVKFTLGRLVGDTFKVRFLTEGSSGNGEIYYTLHYSETADFGDAVSLTGADEKKASSSLTYSFVPTKAGYYWVTAHMVNEIKGESEFTEENFSSEDGDSFPICVLSAALDSLTVNKPEFTETGEQAILYADIDGETFEVAYKFYHYVGTSDESDDAEAQSDAVSDELAGYEEIPAPDGIKYYNDGDNHAVFYIPDAETMPDGDYLAAVEVTTHEGYETEPLRKTCKFSIRREGPKLDAIIAQDVNGTQPKQFGPKEDIGFALKYSSMRGANDVSVAIRQYDENEEKWSDWGNVDQDSIQLTWVGEIVTKVVLVGGVEDAGRYRVGISMIGADGQKWLPVETEFTVGEEHIHRYNPNPVKKPKVEPTKDETGNNAYSYLECQTCDKNTDGHYATVDGRPMTADEFEAFVESYIIYCKTTSVKILDELDYEIVGNVLDYTIEDSEEPLEDVILHSMVEPEGKANPKLSWSSSNSAVAEITADQGKNGETARVKLLKPGTAVITARAIDGSGQKDSVTVNVYYKYETQNINLKLVRDGEEIAEPRYIQKTEKVELEAYCDDGKEPIALEDLEVKVVSGSAYVEWDKENGTLTGVKPGSFKLRATLRDDPLGRKAEISGKVTPIVPNGVILYEFSKTVDSFSKEWKDGYIAASGFDMYNSNVKYDEGSEDGVRYTVTAGDEAEALMLYQQQSTKTQTYTLVLEGYNSELVNDEQEITERNNEFTWSNPNSKLVSVSMNTTTGKVTISVKANQNGECYLTATSKYNPKLTVTIHVVVHDYQPKLTTNQITMNIAKEDSSETVELSWNKLDAAVIDELNGDAGTLRLYDTKTKETVDALKIDGVVKDTEDATKCTVTIVERINGETGKSMLKPGTWKLMLEVPTEHSEKPYQLPLTVVVQENKPTVSIKQTRKVNLKGVDGYGVLEFTAKAGKEDVIVKPSLNTDNYKLYQPDPEKPNVYWIIPTAGATAKNNSKLTLTVKFDGYEFEDKDREGDYDYVKKNFTIGVESKIVTKSMNSYKVNNSVKVDLVKDFEKNGFYVVDVVAEKGFSAWIETGHDELFIESDVAQSAGTHKLFITVQNTDDVTLTGQINVAVKNVLPTVTVKQTKRVNLSDPDSMGLLTITAKDTTVSGVKAQNMDFYVPYFDEEAGSCNLVCTAENRLSTKLDKTGTLIISLGDEYQDGLSVKKSITVSTEKVVDKVYLASSTLTLYRKLQNMEASTELSRYWVNSTLDEDAVVIKNADKYDGLHIEYDAETQALRTWFDGVTPIKAGSYRYNIEVTLNPEKPKEITKLTVTVKVVEAPKVTISPTAVKMSRSDPDQEPVFIKVTGTKFGDAELTGFTILPDTTSNRYPFEKWFDVEWNEETEKIKVYFDAPTESMREGRTYQVRLQPEFTSGNGTDVGNPITLKIAITK